MALVAFLRGVNVGGHNTFQPRALASRLKAFDVASVGAAGTFVVRGTVPAARLRSALLRALPFTAEIMICRGRDLVELTRTGAFPAGPSRGDVGRFVSVLAKRPRTLPRLPISRPDGDGWQVRLVAVSGPFVLSLRRRLGRTPVYPNEVVEENFGVPATTRNWNTIAAIGDLLEGRP